MKIKLILTIFITGLFLIACDEEIQINDPQKEVKVQREIPSDSWRNQIVSKDWQSATGIDQNTGPIKSLEYTDNIFQQNNGFWLIDKTPPYPIYWMNEQKEVLPILKIQSNSGFQIINGPFFDLENKNLYIQLAGRDIDNTDDSYIWKYDFKNQQERVNHYPVIPTDGKEMNPYIIEKVENGKLHAWSMKKEMPCYQSYSTVLYKGDEIKESEIETIDKQEVDDCHENVEIQVPTQEQKVIVENGLFNWQEQQFSVDNSIISDNSYGNPAVVESFRY